MRTFKGYLTKVLEFAQRIDIRGEFFETLCLPNPLLRPTNNCEVELGNFPTGQGETSCFPSLTSGIRTIFLYRFSDHITFEAKHDTPIPVSRFKVALRLFGKPLLLCRRLSTEEPESRTEVKILIRVGICFTRDLVQKDCPP